MIRTRLNDSYHLKYSEKSSKTTLVCALVVHKLNSSPFVSKIHSEEALFGKLLYNCHAGDNPKSRPAEI